MKLRLSRLRALAGAAITLVSACGSNPVILADPADGGGVGGRAVGEPCDAANGCRTGLACVNGLCEPGRASDVGTPCVISAECKEGTYCGPERKCAPAGAGADGASCTSDADCMSGLRCNLVGFAAQCAAEGKGDVGTMCTTGADCFGGLACADGKCAPLPPSAKPPLAILTWKGADCVADTGPVQAYFRVPRGTDDGDFFRLPFPNDVRRGANGRPLLNGFPTPGNQPLGYDVVDRYARDLEQNADGFSTYPTVTMRFSGAVDFDSLKIANTVRWVEVTTTAGTDIGLGWSATTGRSAYVCEHSISIRPQLGVPLKPGATYAVFITNNAKAGGGAPIQRSADLAALLASTAPADAALAAHHGAYAAFRAWAAAKSLDLATIVNATVFTVGSATNPAQRLATAVAAAPLPTATSWVSCTTAASPCPDAAGERACGAPDPAFDELHALVSLPIWQKGTAPYLQPADGGDVADTVQRTEQVCLALTVPKGATMPGTGWPLVVFAHGTGGHFRSHITQGVAKELALVDGAARMAVLGIDQVQHGPRRNGSTQTPDNLFFNFANPLAARGNPLQGAADQMALVRFARALTLAPGASPTGQEIRFGRVAYWGHSQGATEGAIALPYTPNVGGAVLSGEGASLVDALLSKTSPVNIPAVLPFVLVEPGGVSGAHPVLSLLQNAIDVADPLNHGRAIAAAPTPAGAKHVLVPFGLKDTFTPSIVQKTFVIASGIGLAASPAGVAPEPIEGASATPVPAGGNLAGGSVTAFARQYAPAQYDGHFVVFQDPIAKRDAARFLADVTANVTPQVGR